MSELTREQIEEWREAFDKTYSQNPCPEYVAARRDTNALCDMALSALDVRERCAQVCDRVWQESNSLAISKIAGQLAREIRALDLGAQDQRGAAVQDADQALSELGEPTPREATSLEGNPANRVGHLAVERSDRSSQEQALNPPSVQPAPHPLTAMDESPSPAPARGLARLCERRCYSIAESERCSDCPSLQPQARGLSAVEDVEAHKREGMFSDSAGRYYHNAVGVDLAFRHAEELGRLRKENAELRSEREGMVLVPQTEMQTIYERFKECHERLQKADGVRHSWADPYIAIAKERAK